MSKRIPIWPVISWGFTWLVVLCLLVASAAHGAISNFDAGDEGWLVADIQDGGPYNSPVGWYPVQWTSVGGNPGGCISSDDPSGNTFFFAAASQFLGNKSLAYGTALEWDIRISDGPTFWDIPDVVLVSGDTTLVFQDPNQPTAQQWTHQSTC